MILIMMAVSGRVEEQMKMLHRAGTILLLLAFLCLLAAVVMFFRMDILRMIRLDSGMDARKRIRQLNRKAAEQSERCVPTAESVSGGNPAAIPVKAEIVTEVMAKITVPEMEIGTVSFLTTQLQHEGPGLEQPEKACYVAEGFVMETDLVVVHGELESPLVTVFS